MRPRLCRSTSILNNEVQGGREWHHIRFVRLGTIATVTRYWTRGLGAFALNKECMA